MSLKSASPPARLPPRRRETARRRLLLVTEAGDGFALVGRRALGVETRRQALWTSCPPPLLCAPPGSGLGRHPAGDPGEASRSRRPTPSSRPRTFRDRHQERRPYPATTTRAGRITARQGGSPSASSRRRFPTRPPLPAASRALHEPEDRTSPRSDRQPRSRSWSACHEGCERPAAPRAPSHRQSPPQGRGQQPEEPAPSHREQARRPGALRLFPERRQPEPH